MVVGKIQAKAVFKLKKFNSRGGLFHINNVMLQKTFSLEGSKYNAIEI